MIFVLLVDLLNVLQIKYLYHFTINYQLPLKYCIPLFSITSSTLQIPPSDITDRSSVFRFQFFFFCLHFRWSVLYFRCYEKEELETIDFYLEEN